VLVDFKGQDILQFYEIYHIQIPEISGAVKKFILVQPSSAMAERILAVFELVSTSQTANALADSLEYQVSRRYNDRKPARRGGAKFTSSGLADLVAEEFTE